MQATTEQTRSASLKIERPLGGVLWRAVLLVSGADQQVPFVYQGF